MMEVTHSTHRLPGWSRAFESSGARRPLRHTPPLIQSRHRSRCLCLVETAPPLEY
jgi:hypothetical protein